MRGRQAARKQRGLAETGAPPRGRLGLNGSSGERPCQAAIRTSRATGTSRRAPQPPGQVLTPLLLCATCERLAGPAPDDRNGRPALVTDDDVRACAIADGSERERIVRRTLAHRPSGRLTLDLRDACNHATAGAGARVSLATNGADHDMAQDAPALILAGWEAVRRERPQPQQSAGLVCQPGGCVGQ